MTVLALDGVVRRYAWGSTTLLQSVLGEEPDGRPAAELWFGAHPDDPSTVPVHGCTLEDVIDRDPPAALGRQVVDRFGPRLPYLLKLLAAGQALSMQVHPNLAQARAGYAADNAAGLAADAPDRNYRDPNHKPELLCALTDFDALCGFRPVEQTLAMFDRMAVPELDFVAAALRGPDPLRAAFTAVQCADRIDGLARLVGERAAADDSGELAGVARCAEDFPGDVGVVLALLLNHVRLAPGEAIFLGAGVVHAYLRGMGVEVMANSDNVLRCGLTGKHVDVAELVRITDFTALPDPRWPDQRGAFHVPVPDFRLVRIELDAPTGLDDGGPCIVLCTRGTAQVGAVPLRPGGAAFVPAGDATTISGSGEVFVAGVGDPT